MEEVALISLMSILVLLSAFCSIVLGKLKMPSLIGFLVAGIIIANTMELSEDAHTVIEVFSNLGLIMLMFSIGMEIDVRKLKSQGKFAVIVAAVQLPLMVIGGVIVGTMLGFNMLQSITLGCVISGSSTAVVMAILKANGKLSTEDLESLVLIVIMEDIGQVIMLSMLTPMLGGSEMSSDALIVLIVEIAIFMIACFTVGLYVVPRIIDWFYERSNDELISLLCIGAAFTLAWAANGMGLSVAIGAFLAGVFVGMTKPRHAVEHFVDPLKSIFMAMFFISVGMEVMIGSLIDNIVLILIIFLTFIICKSLTVYLGYWIGHGDNRVGAISAMSLCAMGEFAFIIAKQALDSGVVEDSFYSSIIGAALISMVTLPFMSKYSDKVYDTTTAKMPDFLKRFFAALTGYRDRIYHEIDSVSSKTKSSFLRGLANIYFLLFFTLIIEVIFYYSYDPLCEWLVTNFGMEDIDWRVMILILNLIILLYPLKKVADYLRTALYVIEFGRKNVEREEYKVPKLEEKAKFHETMSTWIIGAIMDIILVMLVPNGIDNMMHINVSIILLIAFVLYQAWKFKKGKKSPVPVGVEEEIEPQPEQI